MDFYHHCRRDADGLRSTSHFKAAAKHHRSVTRKWQPVDQNGDARRLTVAIERFSVLAPK